MFRREDMVSEESLTGVHKLSAVDTYNKRIDQLFFNDMYDKPNAISFTLDGVTYTAFEDPSDGYRSYFDGILPTNVTLMNQFPPVDVIVRITDHGYYTKVLEFIVLETAKTVLEFGTDHSDDYYPMCILRYDPTALRSQEESDFDDYQI